MLRFDLSQLKFIIDTHNIGLQKSRKTLNLKDGDYVATYKNNKFFYLVYHGENSF